MTSDRGYRPDIDGLRTLAVIPVVLFHARIAPFGGGYVGVDVFFVISGFLITRILLADLDRDRFSLWTFYERRARRILPALAACVAATVIAALFVLPPSDMTALGASVLRVAGFLSNVHFWREGGYFGRDSEEQPLLHTWSLAVEEQFYIVWPVMLALAIYRLRRPWQAGVVVSLVALSFAAAVWKTGFKSSFFLPQYRAWELGLGAMLAMGLVPELRARWLRQALSALGLLLILAPVFLYSSATRFPGLAALPPCLGAALLIHANAGQDTVAARLLSWKPMVAVGLISYSLYLWHWPVLVLGRLALNRAFTGPETALALEASFALAYLSWRFVEGPFRNRGRIRIHRRVVLAGSAAVLAVMGSAGQAAVMTRGASWRASSGVMQAERAVDSINPNRESCHASYQATEPPPEAGCTRTPGRYQVLLWGDSHADHFAPAVKDWAVRAGLDARQASKSGCRPLLTDGVSGSLGVETTACVQFNRRLLEQAASAPNLRLVILSGWWMTGEGALRPQLERTVAKIHARLGPKVRVLLLGTTPSMGFWPAQCLSRARYNHRDEGGCRRAPATNAIDAAGADRILATVAGRAPNTRFLPLWDSVCSGADCRTVQGEVIMLRDENHFTVEGARRVLGPRLAALGPAIYAR